MRTAPDHVKSKVSRAALLFAVLGAGLAPLLAHTGDAAVSTAKSSPGWPTHYEGQVLTELPLTPREMSFVREFPGRVGRFSDGRREIIMRWVDAPTRRLHPASDCLRASGYGVTPLPVIRNAAGGAMSCFRAHHRSDA